MKKMLKAQWLYSNVVKVAFFQCLGCTIDSPVISVKFHTACLPSSVAMAPDI